MLNEVRLIGYVGKAPDLRFTPSGVAVANFTFATSENWTDDDGEKKYITDWHRIVCFRKTAEVVGDHVKKGQQLCVLGKIRTRKWEDKGGEARWTTEIIAGSVIFLGKKSESGEDNVDGGSRPISDDTPF